MTIWMKNPDFEHYALLENDLLPDERKTGKIMYLRKIHLADAEGNKMVIAQIYPYSITKYSCRINNMQFIAGWSQDDVFPFDTNGATRTECAYVETILAVLKYVDDLNVFCLHPNQWLNYLVSHEKCK